MSKQTKGLVFAPFIRVSTEPQAKQGESLKTQKSQLTEAIKILKGTIHDWYGGQESGTGEQEEMERLMRDAKEKNFNAIIVVEPSRWSRDNARHEEYKKILKKSKIRFFTSTQEMNLFDPTEEAMLDMTVTFAKYQRKIQAAKSLLNRIARAKRGYPSSGKLPFGRRFNKEKGEWEENDPEDQSLVETMAEEYLKGGVGFVGLARKYGMTVERVWRILTQKSGTDWPQHFKSQELDIDEIVPTKIPRLLSESTIRAIRTRAYNNRTWDHKPISDHTCKGKPRTSKRYLLGKRIWDIQSGYSLIGAQVNGIRYYRIQGVDRKKVEIPKRFNVRADLLEDSVMEQLFSLMDSEAAKGAIKAGTPNAKDRQELEERRKYYQKAHDDKKGEIDNLVTLAQKMGGVKIDQAAKRIPKLKEEVEQLEADIEKVNEGLNILPTQKDVEDKSKAWEQIVKQLNLLDHYRDNGLSFEMKRKLIRLFFDGTGPDGKKLGVYVRIHPPKNGEKKPTFGYHAVGVFGDIYGAIKGGGAWWPKEGGEYAKAAIMDQLKSHSKQLRSFIESK